MSIAKLRVAAEMIEYWLEGNSVSPNEALRFFNAVRMAIEGFGYSSRAPTLRSYCDLLFHEQLDRKAHVKFLVSVSDALRDNFKRGEGPELLYGQLFLLNNLQAELIEFFESFQQMSAVWFLVSRSAELLNGLFANLVGHSICIEGKYPFETDPARRKRIELYGHDLQHVVRIDFDVADGYIAAKLHVMDVLEPQEWPMFIEVSTRVAN